MPTFDLEIIQQNYLDLMERSKPFIKNYGPFLPFLQGLNCILSDHYRSMDAKNTYQLYRNGVVSLIKKFIEIFGDEVFQPKFCFYLINQIQNLESRDSSLTFRFIYQEIIYLKREKEDLIWDLIYAFCDDHFSKLNSLEHSEKEKEAVHRALQKFQELNLTQINENLEHNTVFQEEAMRSFRMFRQII